MPIYKLYAFVTQFNMHLTSLSELMVPTSFCHYRGATVLKLSYSALHVCMSRRLRASATGKVYRTVYTMSGICHQCTGSSY